MKKLVLSIATVCLLVTSCNQVQELSPKNDFNEEIVLFSEMNRSGFHLATSSFGNNITFIGQSELDFDRGELTMDVLKGLNGHYFEASESTIHKLANQYIGVSSLEKISDLRTSGTVDLSTFEFFSTTQLTMAQAFVDELLNSDDLKVAKSNAILFQQNVIASYLTEEDKLGLLALSISVVQFVEFAENGGIDEIENILAANLGIEGFPNGRFRRCAVNTRSVLAGGVVGFVSGAAVGCYAGAMAGTVAFPLVGTVTGCASAGMIAGAGGFISGVISGIASELITSCGR